MLLATTGLLMAACSDNYKDWASQQTYPQEEPITIPGFTACAIPADLNTSENLVKVVSLTGAVFGWASTTRVHFVSVEARADSNT